MFFNPRCTSPYWFYPVSLEDKQRCKRRGVMMSYLQRNFMALVHLIEQFMSLFLLLRLVFHVSRVFKL